MGITKIPKNERALRSRTKAAQSPLDVKPPVAVPKVKARKLSSTKVRTVSSKEKQANIAATTPGSPGRVYKTQAHERRETLMRDPWTDFVERSTVSCRGCRRNICLDSRPGHAYYHFHWGKHKKRCFAIKHCQAEGNDVESPIEVAAYLALRNGYSSGEESQASASAQPPMEVAEYRAIRDTRIEEARTNVKRWEEFFQEVEHILYPGNSMTTRDSTSLVAKDQYFSETGLETIRSAETPGYKNQNLEANTSRAEFEYGTKYPQSMGNVCHDVCCHEHDGNRTFFPEARISRPIASRVPKWRGDELENDAHRYPLSQPPSQEMVEAANILVRLKRMLWV